MDNPALFCNIAQKATALYAAVSQYANRKDFAYRAGQIVNIIEEREVVKLSMLAEELGLSRNASRGLLQRLRKSGVLKSRVNEDRENEYFL